MESRNPALRNAIKQAEAGGTTAPPPPPPTTSAVDLAAWQQAQAALQGGATGGQTVQLPDVIAKSGIMFFVLLVFAVVGWTTALSMPWLWIVAALVALVLGLVNTFKKKVSPPLTLLYAVFEGITLGGISQWYQQYAIATAPPGQSPQPLVLQAVIGTLVAFGVMLFLYSSKIIKVNGTFMKVFFVAMISYVLIGIASLLAAIFGVGGGWGFYGVGGLGILLCVFGVGLAAFALALDFESIKQAIAYGLPERESWRLGFGLMVTLVWLYLEILRLLAIVSNNR